MLTERSHTLVELKRGALPFLVEEITMVYEDRA